MSANRASSIYEECVRRTNKLMREVKEFVLLYERVSPFFAKEVLYRSSKEGETRAVF